MGSLYVLAFPPFNFIIFGFICIILCTLIFTLAKSFLQICLLSFAFTLGLSVFGFYWIVYAANYVLPYEGLSLLILVGFSLLYSIPLLPAAYLINKSKYVGGKFVFITLIAWSFVELFKQYFMGGLPWYLPAQLWNRSLPILQSASVVGVLGLSVLTLWLLLSFLILGAKNRTLFFKIKFIMIPWVLFLILYIGGLISLVEMPEDKNTPYIDIRIVQPNIKQNDKQNPEKLLENFKEIIALTFNGLDYDNPPKYIILPEVVFNLILEDNPLLFKMLLEKIPKGSYLLIGALRLEDNKLYNSLYQISGSSQQIVKYYDKIRLVPFGEYIPFSEYVPWVSSFVGLYDLRKGDKQTIFDAEVNEHFLALICFEGIFSNPNISSQRIQWLLNVSNEAWFNSSIEFEQNLSLFRFRSIEGGIPSVKVSNTGISAIIDNKGKIIYQSSKTTKQVVNLRLSIKLKNTINSDIGNKILMSVILTLFLINLSTVIKKNTKQRVKFEH
ncbi:Apolipoprotein N-acyltransferase [Candidatus Hepatincolaceae symbiont of Richtersius coronifer]